MLINSRSDLCESQNTVMSFVRPDLLNLSISYIFCFEPWTISTNQQASPADAFAIATATLATHVTTIRDGDAGKIKTFDGLKNGTHCVSYAMYVTVTICG